VARVLPTMVRWLPEKALLALNGALELDLMSHRFDLDLCEQLRRGAIEPGHIRDLPQVLGKARHRQDEE